ncbi:hypothetical protein TNCV_2810621 [Trichonephila clavipes]|nr:hypothetical protein TNCV_2810621 [Trichonephila clavipes]
MNRIIIIAWISLLAVPVFAQEPHDIGRSPLPSPGEQYGGFGVPYGNPGGQYGSSPGNLFGGGPGGQYRGGTGWQNGVGPKWQYGGRPGGQSGGRPGGQSGGGQYGGGLGGYPCRAYGTSGGFPENPHWKPRGADEPYGTPDRYHGGSHWGHGGPRDPPPNFLDMFPDCSTFVEMLRNKFKELLRSGEIGPRNCQEDRKTCRWKDMEKVRCAAAEEVPGDCLQQITAFILGETCNEATEGYGGTFQTEVQDGEFPTEVYDEESQKEINDGEFQTEVQDGELQTEVQDSELQTVYDGELQTADLKNKGDSR